MGVEPRSVSGGGGEDDDFTPHGKPAELILRAYYLENTILYLQDIDSAVTSPPGNFRWLDVADQQYAARYRDSYDYTEAYVLVTYDASGDTLGGSLYGVNLKPNFAYQVKMEGVPGTPASERIGLAGRWWQEEWDGAAWSGGQNLNNRGTAFLQSPMISSILPGAISRMRRVPPG